MNQELKKKYLGTNGEVCPYCEKLGHLEGDSVDIEAGKAYQAIWCSGCDHHWVDIYTLVDVSPLED